MTEGHQTNAGRSLILIHRCLTRAIQVATQFSERYARQGFPDPAVRRGFSLYLSALATGLESHHLNEDEVSFPFLRPLMPAAPFDLLFEQHQEIIPLIETIRAASQELAGDDPPQGALQRLHASLLVLAEIWKPHIQVEEAHFTPQAVDELLTRQEHDTLNGLIAQHSREHTVPDYLLMPFVLYNLSPGDRVEFSLDLPPVLTEQLVPLVWKEKWQAMTPFLLSA